MSCFLLESAYKARYRYFLLTPERHETRRSFDGLFVVNVGETLFQWALLTGSNPTEAV